MERIGEIDKMNFEFKELLSLCENIKDQKSFLITDELVFNDSLTNDSNPFVVEYSKRTLKAIKECSLSKEEAILILAYAGGLSSWINDEFRKNKLITCNCKLKLIELLNKTLYKIKSYSSIVYRMDSPIDNNKELNWFSKKISSKLRIPYFLSTSKEKWEKEKIFWEITPLETNSLAKDISEISLKKNEQEVLFMTNACFEITGVDKKINWCF